MNVRGAAVAAVDLGATSGRVILGRVEDERLHTKHIARFANDPVRTREGLHWNLLGLYREILRGLTAAEREAPGEIASIGIDSWAVDYGLLRGGRLLGLPRHYRDERNEAGVAAVREIISDAEQYERNGLQHLVFNTVFQLATEGDFLGLSDRLLLIPDLLGYWLTGVEAAERTNASTTGLLSASTAEWDAELAARLGVPPAVLPRLIDPGTALGPLAPEAAQTVGRAVDVVAVASHDTASAVAAVPATDPDFAYISCGTWGLVGLELDAPVLTEEARRERFTNELGVDGRTRFLHNVMGLWLLSESLRHWEPAATDAQRSSLLGELLAEAARLPSDVPLFDVDDPVFLPTGDIPGRIRDWYREHGEREPSGRAETVRRIIESLAGALAASVRTAAGLAGRDVSVIHIVGGGSQNALLCQAIADRSGLRVLAGPTEATAMGNMLIQARALGLIAPGLDALRGIVARSAPIIEYSPAAPRVGL
ncbi:rhamnulokinase [Leucobacter weissii]|uniref:Rhamnulokinase n=1 Tax=Leucobacter weissii TaxID=1983706 RepID=A0A939SB32_9MICO|nr:rhamnulokinase family protein [Leucobacter weissii]MBO1901075.1 rhamnulokinase [Leucobacter weissii]